MENTQIAPKTKNEIDRGKWIEAENDGLKVFIAKSEVREDEVLNDVRRYGSRMDIYRAFMAIRGMQAVRNYAQRYGTEEEQALLARDFDMVLDQIAGETEAKKFLPCMGEPVP